jgi:hypothetical protein
MFGLISPGFVCLRFCFLRFCYFSWRVRVFALPLKGIEQKRRNFCAFARLLSALKIARTQAETPQVIPPP